MSNIFLVLKFLLKKGNMSPETTVSTEVLPTDIRALLITSQWEGVQVWRDVFAVTFGKFGDLSYLFTVDSTDLSKRICQFDPDDFEVIFVACKGREPKEILYPHLRKTHKDALIITIPTTFDNLSSDSMKDYLIKQPDGTPYTDDVWRGSYDPDILSLYLIELAQEIENKRKLPINSPPILQNCAY